MRHKILLPEDEMLGSWYNIQADISVPPPLNPSTKEPMDIKDMEPIFPKELLRQEVSTQRWIKNTRRGQRDIHNMETNSPLQSQKSGKIPENTCEDLLQMGRCEPTRKS